MSFSNEEWRDAKKDANRVGVFGIKWVLIIVGLILIIGAGIWLATVLLSPAVGQGEAYQEKNSAENWTAAQAEFEQNYQDILSTDLKIDLAYSAWQSDIEDQTKEDTYHGLQSYCLSAVAEYNADARSYLSEDFRASDLPEEIDTNNSTTDCKENTQ